MNVLRCSAENPDNFCIEKNCRKPDVSCRNLKGRQLKETDTVSYLCSVVIRNGKIQN